MRGDAEVGLEEVSAALLVRHPALVEEDDAVAQAELLRARDGPRPPSASRARAGSDGGRPRKTSRTSSRRRASSATASITVSGSNQFQMPPGHSSTRSFSPIPGTTPLSTRRVGVRRLGIDPERDDVDQVAQRGIAREAVVVDASGLQQRTEPEVALRLARADERVAGAQDHLLRSRFSSSASGGCRSAPCRASSARFSMWSGA